MHVHIHSPYANGHIVLKNNKIKSVFLLRERNKKQPYLLWMRLLGRCPNLMVEAEANDERWSKVNGADIQWSNCLQQKLEKHQAGCGSPTVRTNVSIWKQECVWATCSKYLEQAKRVWVPALNLLGLSFLNSWQHSFLFVHCSVHRDFSRSLNVGKWITRN